MAICVALTQADITLTKDVIGIAGTVGALIIGGLGLSTWRRQLHGTSKFQVAKDILTATYRLQDSIQAVRSPMLHLRKEEVEAGRRIEEEQRIYSERLQRLETPRSELRALALEAKAIWGEPGQESFQPVLKLIGTLNAAVWYHFWLKGAYAGPGTTVDRDPKKIEKNDNIIYFVSEDDEFSLKIKRAVEGVEAVFQPRLRE